MLTNVAMCLSTQFFPPFPPREDSTQAKKYRMTFEP